jgi:hypothetical protein
MRDWVLGRKWLRTGAAIGWQFIENLSKIDSEKQGKDPQLIVFVPAPTRPQSRLRLCYTKQCSFTASASQGQTTGEPGFGGLGLPRQPAPDASASLNEPQHTLLPAAPTPRWGSPELKEPFHDFRTRI